MLDFWPDQICASLVQVPTAAVCWRVQQSCHIQNSPFPSSQMPAHTFFLSPLPRCSLSLGPWVKGGWYRWFIYSWVPISCLYLALWQDISHYINYYLFPIPIQNYGFKYTYLGGRLTAWPSSKLTTGFHLGPITSEPWILTRFIVSSMKYL